MDNEPSNSPQSTDQLADTDVPVTSTEDIATPPVPSPSDPVTTGLSSDVSDTAPVVDVITSAPSTPPSEASVPESTPVAATPIETPTDVPASQGESPSLEAPELPAGTTDTPAPVVPVSAPASSPVKKQSKTTLILVGVVVVLIIAAVIYFLVTR